MSDQILGYFLIIAGILVFVFKEPFVRHRMSIYTMLNKKKKQNELLQAEKIYRFSMIFGAIVLIILGGRYLLL